MEQQNSPLSGETPSRSILSYLFFLLLAILPIVIAIVIHIRLGPEDYAKASAEIKRLIPNWFKLAPAGDPQLHFYYVISRGVMLLQVLHSFVCMIGGAILFGMTIKGKNKSLRFMAVPYVILSVTSVLFYLSNLDLWNAGTLFWYNRFYLVFFDISVFHGPAPIIIYSAIIAGYVVFLVKELRIRKNTRNDGI